MKKHEISLEICRNQEWLENYFLDLSDVDETAYEYAVSLFLDNLCRRLSTADYSYDWPQGQRTTCHGWHGANTFAHKIGPVGTFDDLTAKQVSEIEHITFAAAGEAINEAVKRWPAAWSHWQNLSDHC